MQPLIPVRRTALPAYVENTAAGPLFLWGLQWGIMRPGLGVLELVNVMVEYLNRNYGAVLVILTALTLAGAGFGWVISEIDGVRDDVSVEINGVRDDVNGVRDDVSGVRAGVSVDLNGVRDDVSGQINGVRGEVNIVRGEVNAVRSDLSADIADVRGEVAELRGEVTVLRGEVTVLRGEVRDVQQDLADTERRLTEKLQVTDARVVAVEQSLLLMNAKIDAFLEAIANHSHTEDGEVIFTQPAADAPGDGAPADPDAALPSDAELDADAAGAPGGVSASDTEADDDDASAPDNRTPVPATAR